MRKCLCILCCEYKMQMKRPAGWGVMIAATIIALMDNFPTTVNLHRLEFLTDPAYFVCRTMSLDGLIMVFGLMFLLSSRFPLDQKTGVKALIMASPMRKGQYIAGKMLGGFLYAFTMLALFLSLSTLVYWLAAPFRTADCLLPLCRALLLSALPVSLFTGLLAVGLAALMDVRLFYLIASVLFIVNASTVGSAGSMPFYMITSGDLTKLLWTHPKWPYHDPQSIALNLLFLLGSGALTWIALLVKRAFWRAE